MYCNLYHDCVDPSFSVDVCIDALTLDYFRPECDLYDSEVGQACLDETAALECPEVESWSLGSCAILIKGCGS